MIKLFFKLNILIYVLLSFIPVQLLNAQSINLDARSLIPHTEISFSSRSVTVTEGSTFDVPIFIDTKNNSINGIEIVVTFDKNKLAVVQPSGGNSIIGVWIRPPSYDNSRGTISYTGVIPDGINSKSGLISTVTFKAISTGNATIALTNTSKILLNDGFGSQTILDVIRSNYLIIPKPPEGVRIFSDTHPNQSSWYNNKNPIIVWEKDPGVDGFSYILDDKPATIPENEVVTTEVTKNYENLSDGLWYFHIKAKKAGVWGTTGHFVIRIDTTPPAEFKPEVNYVLAALSFVNRSLISFFTTDNLSGVDHYEVGVIDKAQPATESPVYVQAETPFQVPLSKGSNLKVIVRAIDKAGNVRDEFIDVKTPFAITKFITDNLVYILFGIIILGLVILITHYLVGHHILRFLKKARILMKQEENGSAINIEPKKTEIIQKLDNNVSQISNINNRIEPPKVD